MAVSARGRAVGWGVAAVVFVLGVVWARAWTSARAELEAGRAAQAAGDHRASIERLQFALRWYTPGASAPVEAADALLAIAEEAELRGDRDLALAALRRLRGGMRAVRSVYSPFAQRMASVDDRIAALTADAQLALGQPTIRGRDRAQLVADHRALLALDPTPSPGWSLLVVLGFGGWVAGGFLTLFRGLDADGRVRGAAFLRWGGLTLGAFALWIVGLVYA